MLPKLLTLHVVVLFEVTAELLTLGVVFLEMTAELLTLGVVFLEMTAELLAVGIVLLEVLLLLPLGVVLGAVADLLVRHAGPPSGRELSVSRFILLEASCPPQEHCPVSLPTPGLSCWRHRGFRWSRSDE
jgi:hypothetical protein